MKVAITGAHGAGKSTLAASLARELDVPVLQTPGRWMAARGLPINEEATVSSQLLAWLLQKQFEQEQEEWVAARSLIDIWAYASLAAGSDTDPLATELFAALTRVTKIELRARYDVLFYIPPRIPLKGDRVRSDDEQFRRRTDNEIQRALSEFDVSFVEVDVTSAPDRQRALRFVSELRDRE